MKPIVKISLISVLIIGMNFLIYKWIWGSTERFVVAMDHCNLMFCDFIHHYYPMGGTLFRTFLPTPGYLYSSFFAILLSMIALMPLLISLYFWIVVQVGILIGLLLLPARNLLSRGQEHFYIYLTLILVNYPVLHNFKWGQVSTLILLLVMSCFVLYEKRSKWLAAFLISFAIAIKYYVVIFLFYFGLKRDYRFLFKVFSIAAILLFLIPMLVLGFNHGIEFYAKVSAQQADMRINLIPTLTNTMFLPHVVARWQKVFDISWFSRQFLTGLSYTLCILQFISIAWLYLKRKNIDSRLIMGLMFCTTPFFVDSSWPHYFVYLPFCQSLIFLKEAKTKAHRASKILTAVSIFLSSVFCLLLLQSWVNYNYLGTLFVSNLLMAISLWILALENHEKA